MECVNVSGCRPMVDPHHQDISTDIVNMKNQLTFEVLIFWILF